MLRRFLALGLSLLASQALAATATHEVTTCSSLNQTSYTSGSFTPAARDLLVVFVVASDSVGTATLVASTGTTFAVGGTANYNTTTNRLYAFVANEFSTPDSQTVTVDIPADAATGTCIMVASITGMSRTGANALRQFARQQNQAAATPAPAFLVAALPGNLTLGAVGNLSNVAGMTTPVGWTERGDSGYNTPTTGLEYVTRDSGFTGTTVTWGNASGTAFGDIILELDSSCGASVSMLGVGCH